MKNILFKYLLVVAGFALSLTACEKKELNVPATTQGTEGARVRFFNAAFNINDANGSAMLLNIFANGKQINGNQRVSYSAFAFPGTGIGYAVIPAGNTEFSFNRAIYGIQRTGRIDSIQYTDSIYNKSSFNFENGKFYTIILRDSLPNLSTFVLEDNFKNNVDTTFNMRLVNLITKNGLKNDTIELVRRRDKSILATGITYEKMSEYKGFSIVTGIADSFYIRRVGTTVDFPGLGGSIYNNITPKGQNATILAIGTSSRASSTRTSTHFH
jgi:Domain of unknown function (DUF4397)